MAIDDAPFFLGQRVSIPGKGGEVVGIYFTDLGWTANVAWDDGTVTREHCEALDEVN